MKSFKNIRRISISILLIWILGAGCKKSFLNEYNPSNRTTDNYYFKSVGFESLVTSCYPLLRDIIQQRALVYPGTDVFAAGGWGGVYFNQPSPIGSAYDQYDIRLNASLGDLQTLWDYLYREINRCNAVVGRVDAVTDMADSLKKVRTGEAKFLRALSLFWAVQQWGDVPMPLTETTSASLAVSKTASKDIYTQIITDLTYSVSNLPAKQKDAGRVTQGAAKFLLARVYLTRGWNFNNALGGSNADFTSALQLCDQIISSGLYPLETNWNNLWPLHNTNPNKETASAASSVATCNKSSEVIFSIQYALASSYQGDPSAGTSLLGNDMHGRFAPGGPQSQVAQQARTSAYNRFLAGQICTWAAFRLFDPTLDVRYKGTFNHVSYATTSGSVSLANNNPYPQAKTLTFATGDTTCIAMPWNNPVTTVAQRGQDIPGGTKKYSVINPNEYVGLGYVSGTTPIVDVLAGGGPIFWKFFQPGITYGDGYSTFNDPIFRAAEVYLMAAEAIVKGATGAVLGGAEVYYNKVLDRALGANAGQTPMCAANPGNVDDFTTIGYRATAANISVDMILDERARELLGEGNQRWYDLKRTGTLISRATKYNPWVGYGTAGTPLIAAKHLLRPIPQGMLDNSNPRITQNDGY